MEVHGVTTISLRIPEALDRRLRRIAEKRGVSRSEVIREAVERFARAAPDAADSCLAAATDLVGCVQGPADLSCNKRRLEGFGK
jgi:predicted DNA-binding protein